MRPPIMPTARKLPPDRSRTEVRLGRVKTSDSDEHSNLDNSFAHSFNQRAGQCFDSMDPLFYAVTFFDPFALTRT